LHIDMFCHEMFFPISVVLLVMLLCKEMQTSCHPVVRGSFLSLVLTFIHFIATSVLFFFCMK